MADLQSSPFKSYNLNNRSVRRIMSEYKEMSADKSSLYKAAPLEDNIFEWHFTIRGPRDTEFEGGIYHGRIILPPEYPYKPPDIVFLTPNGRFETDKKICLTISSHHEETWRPCWTIRTVLVALIAFMPTKADGALASLDWGPEERRRLAAKSMSFTCPKCGTHNMTALPPEDLDEKLEAVPQELEIRDSKEQTSAPSTPTKPALSQSTSSIADSSASTEIATQNPLAASAPTSLGGNTMEPAQPSLPQPQSSQQQQSIQPPSSAIQQPIPQQATEVGAAAVASAHISVALKIIDLLIVVLLAGITRIIYYRITEI